MHGDRKQELIDKHRDINVDYNWWSDVYYDFNLICDIIGIGLNRHEPQFSGFCSQGDGASFAGVLDGRKSEEAPAKIREHAPLDEELHRIADEMCTLARIYFPAHLAISRMGTSSYVHDCSMYVSSLTPVYGDEDDWANEVYEVYEDKVKELMRALARWLYRSLEKEYEYLTSDETVWDSIEANELDREEE